MIFNFQKSSKMHSQEVDKHVARMDIAAIQKQGKQLGIDLQQQAEVKAKLLAIYTTVRPVLDFFDGFFLIPKKWRNVIKAFVVAMDAITGWEKGK